MRGKGGEGFAAVLGQSERKRGRAFGQVERKNAVLGDSAYCAVCGVAVNVVG